MEWKSSRDAGVLDGAGRPIVGPGGVDAFAAAMRSNRLAMIVTDPDRDDNPIVFVNDAFLQLTGYAREEIVGSNCRLLQGPETDAATVSRIRAALDARTDINVDILNYRKDGSPFWNALYISPVFDEHGRLLYFFSSQADVTGRKDAEQLVYVEKERIERAVEERTAELRERTAELESALEARTALLHEVDHRVKNNLQMVSALILMQSRTIPDDGIRQSLQAMLTRIEALSTVHRRLYQSDDVSRFDVGDFVRDLVGDLAQASQVHIDTRLDLEPVSVPAESAAPIALIVNELVTNALKHAFAGRDGGLIEVKVKRGADRFRIEIRDDGAGIGVPATGSDGFGMRLIRSIARQLSAEIDWTPADPGTRVTVDMPYPAARAGAASNRS